MTTSETELLERLKRDAAEQSLRDAVHALLHERGLSLCALGSLNRSGLMSLIQLLANSPTNRQLDLLDSIIGYGIERA
jgi:hypothetical protein